MIALIMLLNSIQIFLFWWKYGSSSLDLSILEGKKKRKQSGNKWSKDGLKDAKSTIVLRD